MTFEVPPPVAAKARRIGAAWCVAELPALVDELTQRLSLTTGRNYPSATEALVLEARGADGLTCVLKIPLPLPHFIRSELTVLRLTAGDGCVELLAVDDRTGAMLLERLGAVAGRSRSSTAGVRRDPRRDGTARVAPGDVHAWKTLRKGDGWALVDPDGLLAEPEYDLGVILREHAPGDPHDRAHRLAALAGRDPVATWEWGVLQRVSTGLLLTAIDAQPHGGLMLATADRLSALPLRERDVMSGRPRRTGRDA